MSDRAPSITGQIRERIELSRTKRALAHEIEDLIRQKAALGAQLQILRGQIEQSGLDDEDPAVAERNQRFFEAFVDREVYRVSREENGRFSTLVVDVRDRVPDWFGGFLASTVRVSDLSVRQGQHRFWIFLHGAGSLGRRLFIQRLAANFAVAVQHHAKHPDVAWGGASFPRDGTDAGSLLTQAVDRRERLPIDGEINAFAQVSPRASRFGERVAVLQPPVGAVVDDEDRSDPRRIIRALHEATLSGQSGELIVRSGRAVGRVYVYRSKIAWAHCSMRRTSLADYLVQSCGADADEVRFAFNQCRKNGGNFAETLIEYGTFTRPDMRRVLLAHLRRHLELLLRLDHPEILFLPQSRVYQSDLLFPLSTLLSAAPARAQLISALRAKVNAS